MGWLQNIFKNERKLEELGDSRVGIVAGKGKIPYEFIAGYPWNSGVGKAC